jgi:hypothetical protein
MVISITLAFSACPPVSVLVRARTSSLEAFLGGMGSGTGRPFGQLASRLASNTPADLPTGASYALAPGRPSPGFPYPSSSPHRSNGCDVVQDYQPVGHRLRLSASPKVPTNPEQTNFTQETLDNWRRGFSPLFRYSCRHSHFSSLHGWLTPPLRWPENALLPLAERRSDRRTHSFGD